MVEKDGAPKKRGRKPKSKTLEQKVVQVTEQVQEVKPEEVKEEIKLSGDSIKADVIKKLQDVKEFIDVAMVRDRSLSLRLRPLSMDLFRAINKLK